jgi:hypothetical protein
MHVSEQTRFKACFKISFDGREGDQFNGTWPGSRSAIPPKKIMSTDSKCILEKLIKSKQQQGNSDFQFNISTICKNCTGKNSCRLIERVVKCHFTKLSAKQKTQDLFNREHIQLPICSSTAAVK